MLEIIFNILLKKKILRKHVFKELICFNKKERACLN